MVTFNDFIAVEIWGSEQTVWGTSVFSWSRPIFLHNIPEIYEWFEDNLNKDEDYSYSFSEIFGQVGGIKFYNKESFNLFRLEFDDRYKIKVIEHADF